MADPIDVNTTTGRRKLHELRKRFESANITDPKELFSYGKKLGIFTDNPMKKTYSRMKDGGKVQKLQGGGKVKKYIGGGPVKSEKGKLTCRGMGAAMTGGKFKIR